MTNLQPHPAAELFPLLNGDEYESFKKDIADNGLLEPIWLCEGKILDGRNRYRACGELGIEPKFRAYEGDSPIAFAWSANAARRNLSKSQRAAIAAEMLSHIEAEARKRMQAGVKDPAPKTAEGESTAIAGKQVGVGKTMVRAAKNVMEDDPALFEQVKAGDVPLADAQRKVKQGKPIPPKPRNKPVAERVEQIRKLAAEGYRASQISGSIGLSEEVIRRYAKDAGIALPDAQLRGAPRPDPYRIISTTVDGLEANHIVFDTIRNGEWNIAQEDAKAWHASLGKSIKELNWLRNKLGVIANGN